jgi:hypothetical protein
LFWTAWVNTSEFKTANSQISRTGFAAYLRIRRIGQTHNKSSCLNPLCGVWCLNSGSLNVWVSGLEGAKCKFGAASPTRDGVLLIAGNWHHDEAACRAPLAGLLVAVGFATGGGHPDGQWSFGDKVGIWSGGLHTGNTAGSGDANARDKYDVYDSHG